MRLTLVASVTLLAILISTATAVKKEGCQDGVHNVIPLFDVYNGKTTLVYRNVSLLVYDSKKRPACTESKGARFHSPGYIRLQSGELEVRRAVKPSDGKLELALTLEKDSFFIGQICEQGLSRNSFVPDHVCKFPLCPVIGDVGCKLFEAPRIYTLDDLPALRDFIFVPAMDQDHAEGDWKFEARVQQGSGFLGGVRAGAQKVAPFISVYAPVGDEAAHEEL